jgi:hypothetical protein
VAGLAYTVFPVDISFWILDPLLPGRVLPMASGRLVRTPSQCVSKVPRPAQKGEKVAIDFQRQELRATRASKPSAPRWSGQRVITL